MATELMAGLGALKTAFDLAKGLKDINDATVRNGAVIELQEKILSAQEAQSALVQRVSELEEKVAGLRAWDADKKRYQLGKVGDNDAFAYSLKPGMENGEPAHQLCANCHSDNKKSLLQEEVRAHGRAHVLVCHRCGSEIYKYGERHAEHRKNAGTWNRK